MLVSKARMNKGFLDELVSLRDQRVDRRAEVAKVVTELHEADSFIDSAATVKKLLMPHKPTVAAEHDVVPV